MLTNTQTNPSTSASALNTAATATVTTDANGPLRSCRTTQMPDSGAAGLFPGVTSSETITPSSALYTIRGIAEIGQSKKILKNPSEDFAIQIFADFSPRDPITLTIADPSLSGRTTTGEPTEPQPVSTIQYKVQDIRTTCNFITLIKPTS